MHIRQWFHAVRFSKRFISIFSAIGVSVTGGVTYALAAGVTTTSNGGWTTCTLDAHADVANEMIVRNNGSQPMCLGSSSYGDDFTVTRSSVNSANGTIANYPNIYTGCEYEGANSGQLCTRGHGTPLRVSSLSKDVSSVSYHMPAQGFTGDSSYDIWFNKSGGTPYGRDNGAEIMIWLGSRGFGSPAYSRKAEIDGAWWGYDEWRTSHGGGSWNYIRYWRLSGSNTSSDSSVTLSLLPFFRDAERQGKLSSSWFLTGTEYGFEVSSGGKGLQVKNFTDTTEGSRVYLGGLQHKGK